MMIFQVHPKHGRHIANTVGEAERNVKNGWLTVTEEEFYGQAAESLPVVKELDETSEEGAQNACPKCGRVFPRGLTMHIKYCKS